MTPKVKIFENAFSDSAIGHRNTFCDQIWWKLGVAKLLKGRLVYQTKKIGLHGLVPAPILAEMGRSRPKFPERCHPSTTYTEFGPDRLRFAGLIPERLIFRPKKSIQYRLSAYNKYYFHLSIYVKPTLKLSTSTTSTNCSLTLSTAQKY